jgi:hypothetical protein
VPLTLALSGMAAETWASALKQMGPLVVGSLAPLVVTSVRHQPMTVAAAAVLSAALGKMTFNLGGVPTSFDTGLEKSALGRLVTTSSTNRITRILLGCCFVHGATTMSFRSAKACSSREEPGPLWKVLQRWAGCAAMVFIGATWLSSGYYGQ